MRPDVREISRAHWRYVMPERARSTENTILWVLSIALAAVFLLTGVPKLLGTQTIALQAAAMRGFPTWIRVISGIVEIAGAIGLLVPRLSSVAAAILALLMIPASLTQWVSGEPGVFVPIFLFLILLFLAWRRNPTVVRKGYQALTAAPHPIVREGVIAGLIGAACIAVWFFGVDLLARHPFFTPETLGRGLLRLFGPVPASESPVLLVIAYTIFHVLAFIAVGLLAALIASVAKREPSILLGFVVLFVAVEVGFYGYTGLIQQVSPLGTLAWYQVMIGNLIAALAMGTYLWRAHPEMRQEFVHALDHRP